MSDGLSAETSPKICSVCVLPETFPGIRFNSAGVCNFCLESQSARRQHRKTEYQAKFARLIQANRGGTYDAIMCYSGGKDSTYTLKILKEKYTLSVLAVTFDNGFVPDQTRRNILNVVERLGVDHIMFKPNLRVLSKIFGYCAEHEIFSAKSAERASTICTACMSIIKFTTLRLALEQRVPLIAFGWSPGQAPITSSIMKNNPGMVKMMQKAVFDPLLEVAGPDIRPYFLEERHFSGEYSFPYNVHPLAFLDYNEAAIYASIEELGWLAPADVDANSTNCSLNSFANVVHKKRLRFHPYAFELAGLVREGYMDRSLALSRLQSEEDPRIVRAVKERLNLR